jgi:hypothetical protein
MCTVSIFYTPYGLKATRQWPYVRSMPCSVPETIRSVHNSRILKRQNLIIRSLVRAVLEKSIAHRFVQGIMFGT